MSEDLFIPKLGQTVDEVVLIGWLVEDGARVDFGDPVLEVETDKAIFNVEANAKGYIHFGPNKMGEVVPILTVVATIGKKDEGYTPSLTTAGVNFDEEDTTHTETFTGDEIEKTHKSISKPREKLFVSPRARKTARENDVDLSRITPTGGNGVRVVEADVLKNVKPTPKATPVAAKLAEDVGLALQTVQGSGSKGVITRNDVIETIRKLLAIGSKYPDKTPSRSTSEIEVIKSVPLRGVRKRVFDNMTASDTETVRVTLISEADATDMIALRQRMKSEKDNGNNPVPGFNEFIGIIVAKALKDYPYMNARVSQDGEAIEHLSQVNLGFAVDSERGLVVPVLKDADKQHLEQFSIAFRSLVNRAKSGRATPDDLSGGTFTITNLGAYGVDGFTPVINLPEVAILGVGRIKDYVSPINDAIAIRKRMTLSLVFDHRLVDGASAATFLQAVTQGIESLEVLG